MRADMRLLTAIAMIGICGFAVARGWGIVHFSADMASSDSSERRPEIINKWTSAPDVASAALRAELREQDRYSDPKRDQSPAEALFVDAFDQAVVFGRLAVAIHPAAGDGPADGAGL